MDDTLHKHNKKGNRFLRLPFSPQQLMLSIP